MINTNVVLVLGAGASKPFKYPTGGELKGEAVRNGADLTTWLVDRLGQQRSQSEEFFAYLAESGRSSIDEFLEFRREFEAVGKLVIAKILIQYERRKYVFTGDHTTNWYNWLFRQLTQEGFDSFGVNHLSIITFNYDRSLEFFLATALERSFNVAPADAAAKVKEIPIVHVHGILSPLPHFASAGRSYNAAATDDEMRQAAEGIRIVHQIADEDPEFRRAHFLIKQAEFILFLGFGYARQNIRRLALSIANPKNPHADNLVFVHGTTMGLFQQELEVDIFPLFSDVHGGFRQFNPPGKEYGELRQTHVDVITYLRSYRKFFVR